MNDKDEQLSSFPEISGEAMQYFLSLFKEDSLGGSPEEAQVLSCIPPLVSRELNE